MPHFWTEIFGNDQPVEVEIGSGTGTFILAAAAARPQTNFYGIEHSHSRAAHLEATCRGLDLDNVRILSADAACIVSTMMPAESVSAYHIYFPDPWWKRRHHRRRLFTPPFVAALARTLAPGGRVYVATDVGEVFELMLSTLAGCDVFVRDTRARSPRAGHTTFERKGLARGATIKEATFTKPVPAGSRDYTSKAAPITPAESPS